MMDRLANVIEHVRSDDSIPTLDEAAVKQGVILRILDALGWDTFDVEEVKPEYPVPGGNVDYALRLGGKSRAFLEAKRPKEALSTHQEQLLNYSFKQGVPLAVLTNGLEWWLYLPLREGSWEERRFCVVDLRSRDISQRAVWLDNFLSRDKVRSGEAVRNAESHLEFLRSRKEIEETLPIAWDQLVSLPDDILIELLDEKVKDLCGRKAGPESIKRFLATLTKSATVPPSHPIFPVAPRLRKQRLAKQNVADYLNKHIQSFVFNGQTHKVDTWSQLLTTLAEQIYQLHRAGFDKALELKGRKRIYFSRNAQGMKMPKPVGSSGYYVETHWSSDNCVRRCHDLLIKFGYSEKDLQIETA